MTVRMFLAIASVPVLALTGGGCALSVNPIVRDSESTFDERLPGDWSEQSGSERAVISRGDGNIYDIEYTNHDKRGRFSARLGRVNQRLVLDVWPAPREEEVPDPLVGLLIPGHLFIVLEIGDNEIAAAIPEPDSLLSALVSGRLLVPYSNSGDGLILRGTTEELRGALGSWFEQPGALPVRGTWRRAGRQTAKPAVPVDIPCFEASAWREADRLFRQDPHWLGADGGSSVDLGNGRTLWLFGDSWVDPAGTGKRSNARMVSNTVAIQTGANPATASMKFFWGRTANGDPAAIVPDEGNERHWFGNGVRVGDRLALFLGRIRNVDRGMGFETVGWVAWMVENPDAEPSAWRMHRIPTPTNPTGILVGFGSVIREGNYVYAFGAADPVPSHPIYAARWKAEDVRRGRMLSPEWWAGSQIGWVSDSSALPRIPLFENGQSEATIFFDRGSSRFMEVQTSGFGPADVLLRASPLLTGPWSTPRLVYRPPEYYKPNVMIYSAKAHPQLRGSDLVLTYSTNSFKFTELLTDSLLYYPRFVRLTRCEW